MAEAAEHKQPETAVKEFNISQDDVSKVALIDRGDYFLVPSDLDPEKDSNVIKICCISDTHGKHSEIPAMPKADILVHAGDISMEGRLKEFESYNDWVKDLLAQNKYQYAIVIAGNHDITLEEEYYHKTGCVNFHDGKKEDVTTCNQVIKSGHSIYLEDSVATVLGVTFYGSPYQPEFHEWAFNLPRGEALRHKWAQIPATGVDVLITHGPPKYHGDGIPKEFSDEMIYCGCKDFLTRMSEIKDVQYNVFGHVHEGYGVTKHKNMDIKFVNASTLNSKYFVGNKPIMIYVKGDRKQKYTPAYSGLYGRQDVKGADKQ